MALIYKTAIKTINVLSRFLSKFIPERIKIVISKRIHRFINRYIPNIYDDTNFLLYAKKKKLGLEKRINEIETIVLRGSYSDYAFNPELMKKSFNFGLTSSDLYIAYYQYVNYRMRLSNLKNVVYFLNIPSPGYSLISTAERYRAVAYNYFFNIPYQKKNAIVRRSERIVLKKIKKLKFVINVDNYWGYTSEKPYSKIPADIRVKTHLRENLREPDQLEWFNKLAELVHEDKRNFIIVIPPFRSDYKKLLPSKQVLFKKFFRSNVKHLIIIDLYDSILFNDDDFGDTDHLNEKGALKITNEIKKILDEKGFI